MGKPAVLQTRRSGSRSVPAPPPSYRDDPDALSLHTTDGDHQYDDPELPAYSDVEAAAPNDTASPFGESRPVPMVDQYQSISPSSGELTGTLWHIQTPWTSKAGIGRETSVRMDDRLMQPDELHSYIVKYLQRVPVKPLLNIHGSHYETRRKANNQTEREHVDDFKIMFNLQPFMIAEPRDPWWDVDTVADGVKAYRGSFRKTVHKVQPPEALETGQLHQNMSLEQHCLDFCASKSPLRVFRIARHLDGLDVELLRTEITRIIRGTNYRGTLDVNVTLLDRNVDIYSPHWVNRLRISWVRWIFYLSFLWIFTWPILFFMTKWWCVYNVHWRFSAKVSRASARHYGGQCNRAVVGEEDTVVTYPYASEQAFIDANARLIQHLALSRHNGEATENSIPRRQIDGPSGLRITGDNNVNAAVGFIQNGLNVWNAISTGGASTGNTGYAWGEDS